MKYIKNQKGLSLVEVLIAAALSSIIGVLMVQILVQNSILLTNQTAAVGQDLNLNQADSLITADIKATKALLASVTIGSTNYTLSSNTLILDLPSISTSSGENSETLVDHIVIAKDSNNPKILRRRVAPDPTSKRGTINTVLTTTLSSVQFNYYDASGFEITVPADFWKASQVKYTVNLATTTGFGSQTNSISKTVNLRNSIN